MTFCCHAISIVTEFRNKRNGHPLHTENRSDLCLNYPHLKQEYPVVALQASLCFIPLIRKKKNKYFILSINVPRTITVLSILTCFFLPQFFISSAIHFLWRSCSSKWRALDPRSSFSTFYFCSVSHGSKLYFHGKETGLLLCHKNIAQSSWQEPNSQVQGLTFLKAEAFDGQSTLNPEYSSGQ